MGVVDKQSISSLYKFVENRPQYLTAFLVALSVFLFFCSSSLPGGFYYDDLVVLKDRAVIDFQLSDFLEYTLGRPLTIFTFFLNYKLAGLSKIIFHTTNILIHAANTALCTLIAYRLLQGQFAAALAGGIFGYHFLATESVNYIWGRSALLGTFFVLLGLFVVTQRPGPFSAKKAFLLAFIAFLGFQSRPDALLLLPLAYFAIWILERRRWDRWYVLFLVLAIPAIATIMIRLNDDTDTTMGFDIGFGFKSWASHALAAVLKYFELMVRPDRGSLFHVNPVPGDDLWWGVLALLGFAAIWIWRRQDEASFFGGLVLFLCIGSVVAIPVLETVSDRRVYLSLFGVALMLASVLTSIPWRYRTPLCGILTLSMLIPTFLRNIEWSAPPAILQRAERLYPESAKVQYMLGYYFESLDPGASELHYSKAIRLDPDFPSVHHNLGTLFVAQERWQDAERELLEELRRTPLGTEHPDLVPTLVNLAGIYDTLGKYTEAEPLLLRSLRIQEKALGENHLDLTLILNGVAGLYYAQGRHRESEPLLTRSLLIRESALGPDHPGLVPTLNNLANAYKGQEMYQEAESLLLRSLHIKQDALGPEHPDTTQALNDLAGLYHVQHRYDEAEAFLLRIQQIREKVVGPDHPDLAQTYNNLAEVYKAQGKLDKTESLLLRSLEIQEKGLGSEHPDLGQILNNLGGLYFSQGRYDRAEPLIIRSLQIREKSLGKEHISTAQSLNNLAGIYMARGRYDEAEPLLQRSIEIKAKTLGPDHPDFKKSLQTYANLLQQMGRLVEAKSAEDRAKPN